MYGLDDVPVQSPIPKKPCPLSYTPQDPRLRGSGLPKRPTQTLRVPTSPEWALFCRVPTLYFRLPWRIWGLLTFLV